MLTLILAVLVISCQSKDSTRITTHINVLKKVTPNDLNVVKGFYYSIEVKLSNNTDSILNFWTMNCSWQSNWVFTDNCIRFLVNCPKNYPIVKQIEPQQKIVYNGTIELIGLPKDFLGREFKIGFVLVKKDESNIIDFVSDLRDKIKEKKDIIWSESFKIDK